MPHKIKGVEAIPRGRKSSALTPFAVARKKINAQVRGAPYRDPRGHFKVFTKMELRGRYNSFKGRCAYCALPLSVVAGKTNTMRFMFYIPLRWGGRAVVDNIIPTCTRCEADQSPPPKRLKERIPNVNTIADLVDRLIVEVHKLGWFENKKREEHGKPNPDTEQIAAWDNASRDCCELRSLLKRELNTAISEFVVTLQYKPKREARTFRPPTDTDNIAETITDMCQNSAEQQFERTDKIPEKCDANAALKVELIEQLEEIQRSKQYRLMYDPESE